MKKPSWKIRQNSETGHVLTGWEYGDQPDEYVEVEPFEFNETMQFIEFWRGRSSAMAKLLDSKGQEYFTGLDGFSSMIPKMIDGKIHGTFHFRKQGQQIYLFYGKMS